MKVKDRMNSFMRECKQGTISHKNEGKMKRMWKNVGMR